MTARCPTCSSGNPAMYVPPCMAGVKADPWHRARVSPPVYPQEETMSDDVRERLIERAAQVMHRQRCACSWDQMEHHTTEAAARAHRGHFITRAAAVIDSLGIEMVAQHYPIRTGVPLKDAVAPVFSIAAASRGRDALGVPVVPQETEAG